jgi:hypothetical protein
MTSPDVGAACTGAAVTAAGVDAGVLMGIVVCPLTKTAEPTKTRKIEVYNLLTFNGIFSPPIDLNFP